MATLDNELGFGVADSQGSSAKTSAVSLIDDGGTDKIQLKDVTTTILLDEISTVTDHDDTANRTTDGHSVGANAYQTAARHLSTHDAAFNNALTISGAIEADATLGAHVANADIHYLRPAQTLTVAQTGTGQYATIAAALAAIGTTLPAASISNPYEIAIYPGVYAEDNLSVADYVSLRSVIPWQAQIAGNSANPILIVVGNSVIDGVLVSQIGAGEGIQFTAAGTGNVLLDHVSVIANTGPTLDFNATTQAVTLENGSRISSLAAALISGKTAVCRLVARSTEFNYGGAAAVAALIDINQSQPTIAAGPDLFDSCQFYADNLGGGVTPAAFIDWDANTLWIRNCLFSLTNPATKTFSAIYAQSGTVQIEGSRITWTATAGTAWDFNAGGGAIIQHAATVYDVARTTGAGTISAMSEGAGLFDAISMTGPLTITAPDAQLIDLAPSGTGDTDVIRIIPSAALAAANTWKGFKVDGTALDPAAAGASVFGGHIDLSGIDQTNNPILCGLLVDMPAVATTSEAFHAIKLTGNGNELVLLNKDFLIDLTATGAVVPLLATYSDTATNTVENAAVFKHLTSADMVDGFGVSLCLHIEDDTSGDLLIGQIKAYRDGGFDTEGSMELLAGTNGAEIFMKFEGAVGQITFPLAVASGSGVSINGSGTGAEMYDDGTGFVINGAGGDPLIIGDTVAVQLGDAAGAEEFQVLDSGGAKVAWADSDGKIYTPRLVGGAGGAGDTNTYIDFSIVRDIIRFYAGAVELLTLTEAAVDEVVVNDGGADVDFRVESVGTTRSLVVDGADGQVTMSQTLTVGDGVASKILGVTDGTNTAMMGYDGVPHVVITGDSTFIVYPDDTDSGMNLIARADGTGTGRVRAQTSGGDYIDINHDGVRGTIDSSLGGIRMNDAVDFQGAVVYNDTFWDDLRVPLIATKAGVSNVPDFEQFMDDGAASTGVFAYAFSPSAEEELFFAAQIPHGYKEGTDIYAHIHWSPNGTGAANQFVQWGLEYTWANIDGTFGNTAIATSDASAAGTATTSGDGTMLDAKHYTTDIATIAGAGKTISSVLVCRVFRDATDGDDDYPNDAYGLEIDFHFEIDAPGSDAADHTKF